MRISALALVVFSIAVFNGCASGVDNDFIASTPGAYASTCETFFSDYPISVEKLYELKSRNDLKAPIYIIKDGNFTIVDVRKGIFGVVPIESCNDKWCKIYYPCGQKEYFVKKDEIVKRDY